MKIASGSVDEKYLLSPFTETHLAETSSYLYGFVIIALIILSLALINYMSLTTARATIRAKEVGIRKVIGAKRWSLSVQFFLESSLMTLAAFVLAIVWVELALPLFLNSLELTIDFSFIQSPIFVSIVALLFLVCVLLSGSYPALVL